MYTEEENDSYRVATNGVEIKDDNRTATGTAKSYRKTPFSSRYASKATIDDDASNIGNNPLSSNAFYADLASAPADEHRILLHDLFARLVTDPQMGLTEPQVRANLELYGTNEIMTALNVPAWVRFCKNLFGGSSLIIWAGILLCFTNYSIEVGKQENAPLENVFLGLALIVVILITSTMSFIQETRQANLSKSYQNIFPQVARVIREGEEQEVPVEELVLGDILLINAGERIMADCRILEVNNFLVDNSSLTGESEPQEREINCTNDEQLLTKNMAFYSTYAVQGNCKAVVTRTGINTIMGKMTELMVQNPKADSLITKEISSLIHIMTAISLYSATFLFIIAFLINYFWIDAIFFLIAIIVAIVPEGLLAVVTISLSISAKRMSSKNCLIKNLESVEALGSTSIVLCDKTGTLTQNKTSVAHVWFDNDIGEIDTGAEKNPTITFNLQSPTWKNMARIAVLCNRAEFTSSQDSDKKEVQGTPIESALLKLVESLEGQSGTFRSLHPKVCEIPFNPIIKFQLSVHETQDFQTRGYLLTMIGDPEAVLNRCATALVNGHERTIDDDYISAYRYACSQLGGLGERIVALCDYRLPPDKYPPGFQFNTVKVNFQLSGYRLIGIASIIDPPRANAPDSIAKCQAAGIKVIMITGDHPSTAKAIAKSVGILGVEEEPEEGTALTRAAKSCLLTGTEAENMSREELDSVLMHHQEIVLASFSSAQKLTIVESCQRLGAIVAVTGDGVNDAAALRKANVGIAMGSGENMARDAADIVLLDDNFSSIVIGIEEGRIMFDNLKKILFYTLVSNFAELAPLLLFLVAQVPLPIGALSILCIDLGTDLLPSISLAYENEEVLYETMKRGPRNPIKDGVLDERLLYLSSQMGLIEAAAGIFTYFVIMAENGFWPGHLLGLRPLWDSKAINDLKDSYDQEWTYEDRKSLEYSAHAGFFMSIVLVQWAVIIASRTRRLSVFQKGMGNHLLNFSIIFETFLAFVIIYVPGLNSGLQMSMLNPIMWFPSLPFVIMVFAYDEIRKSIIRKHSGGWIDTETCF